MCFKEGTVILSYGFAVGNSVSFQIHVIVERRLLSSCYLTTRKESYSSVERSWSGGKWAGEKELSEGEGPSWLGRGALLATPDAPIRSFWRPLLHAPLSPHRRQHGPRGSGKKAVFFREPLSKFFLLQPPILQQSEGAGVKSVLRSHIFWSVKVRTPRSPVERRKGQMQLASFSWG